MSRVKNILQKSYSQDHCINYKQQISYFFDNKSPSLSSFNIWAKYRLLML